MAFASIEIVNFNNLNSCRGSGVNLLAVAIVLLPPKELIVSNTILRLGRTRERPMT